MIKFVVVDDNEVRKKRTCDIIIKSMMINQLEFKIDEFSDSKSEIKKYINSVDTYRIYIIELKLNSFSGLEIARYIRNSINDWNSPIIITGIDTNMYYDLLNQKLQVLDYIPALSSIEKNLYEDIDICLKILNSTTTYKYIYKNIEYNIPINTINYVQRDGRRTKIVTKNKTYYQNIAINNIKKILPKYFIISAKGTLLNMKNVKEIDWKTMIVYFKDKTNNYVVTYSHKKEIENYKLI